jgi:hypothetical protein
VPGFSQYNESAKPQTFSLFLYSLDAMIPVLSLHHFDRYYPSSINQSPDQPEYHWVRWASLFQHFIGWLLWTLFIATFVSPLG